jgi:2-dehydropantoate 2-reductase
VRFVFVGAGAVGGVVGGRLAQHGEDVLFVARGEHGRAIREYGLLIESADERVRVDVPVASSIGEVAFAAGDVVVLAVKSQHTVGALEELCESSVPMGTPIVCLQNGVDNERAALRRFPDVYSVCVMCPSGYLEPGVVQAHAWPTAAILDLGRYPSDVDATAEAISAAFERSTLVSVARPDIMRWKHAKLLMNLLNAVDAVFTPGDDAKRIVGLVRTEGESVLRAAGIDFASTAEDAERRGDILRHEPIDGCPKAGSSSWQSLARGTGTIETDHLNGEIVLLGRLHGVPTPVNALLQQWAHRAAATRAAPETADPAAFLTALPATASRSWPTTGRGSGRT